MNEKQHRRFMYWIIILSTWGLYWLGGKLLVDHTGVLNFGKYGVMGAMVIGTIRYIIMENYWRKL